MEISKELFNEIIKLNRNEWERLKIAVDYLFQMERDKADKSLYLKPNEIEKNLKDCPVPIQLQSE